MENLYFKVAKNFGTELTNIALEHLFYNYDVKKAFKSLKDSLGMPDDLIVDLLKQKYVLETNDDGINVNLIDKPADSDCYSIDIVEWVNNKNDFLYKNGKDCAWLMRKLIDNRIQQDKKNIVLSVPISYLIPTYNKGVITDRFRNLICDELELNGKYILNEDYIIGRIKKYICDAIKIKEVFKWIKENCSELFDSDSEYLLDIYTVDHDFTPDLQYQLQCYETGNFEAIGEEPVELNLENYIRNEINISNEIENGIKPVDILDNYSAGWLAPNGDFYGLNGDIANMLHLTIANELFKTGLINSDFDKSSTSYDSWLEDNGWVKIHGNWILYGGYSLYKRNIKNIPLTKEQIQSIHKYGQVCHNGLLSLGYKRETMSAARFEIIEPLMFKKYFDF